MLHAIATSTALLIAAQAGAGVGAEKAAEARGWLGPSRVRLDFSDRTLAEIVEGISAQGPAMLAIRPESHRIRHGPETSPPPRRYSIREPGPVTFWEAVERVGGATETRPIAGYAPDSRFGILLAPSSAHRGFSCNDGAFRVVLTRISYESHFRFLPRSDDKPGPEPPRPDGSSRRPSVHADLLILAEPRLKIVRPVELAVREAVDDRGRSLVPAVPWRQPLEKPSARGFHNQEYVRIPLEPRDDPGVRIKRLAGGLTLEVSANRAGSSPAAVVEAGFDFADVPLP